MQTAWAALAQSIPTENLIASPPGTARHCTGRGSAGRSLIGALACRGTWRVILWPVWASLRFVRGSGSHGGRRAASDRGSPRTLIASPHSRLSMVPDRPTFVGGSSSERGGVHRPDAAVDP